jgi:hypothetical protein
LSYFLLIYLSFLTGFSQPSLVSWCIIYYFTRLGGRNNSLHLKRLPHAETPNRASWKEMVTQHRGIAQDAEWKCTTQLSMMHGSVMEHGISGDTPPPLEPVRWPYHEC